MNQYAYNGPVMEFGRCIADNWAGSTYAASEKKAKSNLAYQFKKNNNRMPASKITLPGGINGYQLGGKEWKNTSPTHINRENERKLNYQKRR